MDHLHIQQALDVEGNASFPVGEALTSLLYLAGIVAAGLYQLWLLKGDAEDRVARRRTMNTVYHDTDCTNHSMPVYSIPNV